MNKVVRILKTEGVSGVVDRGIKKMTKKKNTKSKDVETLNRIFSKQYSKVIVFENNFGWTKIMKQRPQQIAENFDDDVLFIYGSPYDEFKNDNRIDKIKDNLFVVDLNLYRKDIINLLSNVKEKFLMVYSTDFVEKYIIVKYLDYGFRVIYDYVDNIDKDLCNPMYFDLLLERQAEMLNAPYTYVTCTASELLSKALEINEKANIKLISNGADYKHFHKDKFKPIKKLETLKKGYKYVVGYYGALASWFDYELIKKIAKDKDILIVLIGVDFDNTLDKSGVLDLKNVEYLGKIDYSSLADYASYFDICTIPFIVNDITKATNPVKLFEYMSLGKPIVTTDLNECKKYKSVLISKDHNEFIENIEKAKSLIDDKEYMELLNKEALENSWDKKCADIIEFIDSTSDRVSIPKRKNIVIWFVTKVYKYLKWHLIDKNKMNIKTYFKKVFDYKLKNVYNAQIDKVLEECEDCEKIVLWMSLYFGWNVGLYQRPQHIATNMAKSNILYFYDASNAYDEVQTIKKISKNLYLVNTGNKLFFDILVNRIQKIDKTKYLHIYSTEMALPLKNLKKIEKKGFKILYEYIDDLSPLISGTEELPKNILEKYEYCMRNNKNAAVVVTADNIEKDVLRFRNKDEMVYSCNGVDYDHFQVKKDISKVDNRMKKIINQNKPIIGYYGALASWFDYEMIKHLAKKRPDINIVLIGVKYDEHYDTHNLEKFKNIHYLGPVEYKNLPNYAVFFDICTIPFLINDVTQATSPLKLFEYMALHKPIITTAMHECKKYKSVWIAQDNDSFVELVDKCINLDEKKDQEYFDLLEKEARDNTWEHKTEIILDYLDQFEKNN